MKKKSIFAGIFFVLTIAVAATTYIEQRQQQVNKDAAASATDIISTISCILSNMAPNLEANASRPNPDAYLALIDSTQCEPGSASGGGSVPVYSRYWVQPTFANGSLSVEAWGLDQNRAGFIKATMTDGPTDRPPFGAWSVNWCIERNPTNTGDAALYDSDPCAKKGHASINIQGEYSLFYRREQSGSWAPYDKVSLGTVSTNKDQGYGKYYERNNDRDDSTSVNSGHFAFEAGKLKDVANGVSACKDPRASAAGLRRQLWEAYLYDPTTKLVIAQDTDEAAGFPVVKVGSKQSGWAGYEGVRLNGAKTSEQFGQFKRLNGDGATYEAYGSYGVLIKHTNSRLADGLAALDKTVLQANLYRNAFADTLFAGAGYVASTSNPHDDRAQVLFYWDRSIGTEGKFVFIARKTSANGRDGDDYYTFPVPFSYTISELLTVMRSSYDPDERDLRRSYERSIWGFLRGSNADHHILLADREAAWPPAPLSAENVVVTRLTQTNVTPGSPDAPSEDLICIGKCPRDDGVSAKLQLEDEYSFPRTDPRATQYYTLSADGGFTPKLAPGKIIKYEKEDSVDTYIDRNGIDTQRSDFWFDGFVTKAQLEQLKCTRNSGTVDSYCGFDTTMPGSTKELAGTETFGFRGLDYYYVWATGPNRWQKFSGLKKNGVPVQMRPFKPLIFNAPNDSAYGKYAGLKVSAKYVGNGQLWLPGKCENVATGLAGSSACDQTNEVYLHDFIVPTSETEGKVKDFSGTEYLVKWKRQGVWYPRHDDQTVCDTASVNRELSIAQGLTLPTSAAWVNPRGTTGSGGMLDRRPTVADDALPRYIQGVKQ